MKLAKKTLSVALAAVMAASSLAGTVSAFAADPTEVANTKADFKPVTSVATIKTNVKIDTKFAAKSADLTDNDKKAANIDHQIDATTKSNFYKFTPKATGYYTFTLTSTAAYHGYDLAKFRANKEANPTWTDEKCWEGTEVYTSDVAKLKDLVATKDKTADTLKAGYDRIDTVAVADATGTGNEVLPKDAENLGWTDTLDGKTVDATASNGYISSYKYDEATKALKPTYTLDADKDKTAITKTVLLMKNKTYCFKTTQTDYLTTKEVTVKEGTPAVDVKRTQVEQKFVPEAKLTISKSDWTIEANTAEKTQEVAVPINYSGPELVKKNANGYYVEKTIKVPTGAVTYQGLAKAVVVPAKVEGRAVTSFATTLNKAITSVKFNDGIEEIAANAFKDCAQLSGTVEIPASVKKVGTDAFKNTAITKVIVKNGDLDITNAGLDATKTTVVAPVGSSAAYYATMAGFKVAQACAHKWVVTKAATIFATGTKKCSECDEIATIAKVKFAPTAKASKKSIVVKGNAGKVAKLAVWVYNSNGKLVKKQVKKNVTKNTVKVAKAGKYTVKVKAYGPNGAKTASVKKTVKVK